jgi:hypothetical protein
MTKKRLIRNILYCSVFYVLVCGFGIWFYLVENIDKSQYYGLYKDIFPVVAAIPLAYLGFCFQRRSNFHTALRLLWINMIHAVNKAVLFTENYGDREKDLPDVLLVLSKVIDEVRGVYFNINESRTEKGLYPFESLKRIYSIVEEVGKKEPNAAEMKEANAKIRSHWQTIRKTFLAEFDRTEPTFKDLIQ